MVKLRTGLSHRWGRKQTLPLIGEVQISPEGEIEVEGAFVAEIVKLNIGFEIVSKCIEIETTTTTTTVEEVAPAVVESEINEVEKQAIVEALETKTINQLQREYVQNFPASEWRTLNKAKLIAYIMSKI